MRSQESARASLRLSSFRHGPGTDTHRCLAWTLSTESLRCLWQKYEWLGALRRQGPSRTEQRRADMQAIARVYPGGLRQAECLPPPELARRWEVTHSLITQVPALGVEAQRAWAQRELWLVCEPALHACLRALLAVRREQLGRGSESSRLPASSLALPIARLCQSAGASWLLEEVGVEGILQLSQPRQGRLSHAALHVVAQLLQLPTVAVAGAVFGLPSAAQGA